MAALRQTLHVLALFAILLFGLGAGGGDGSSTDTVGVIREFGFPVFVALWFMWRVEKRMDRFTEVVQNLLTTVTIVAKTIDGWSPSPAPRAPQLPPGAP
jgi:hypothetical protein